MERRPPLSLIRDQAGCSPLPPSKALEGTVAGIVQAFSSGEQVGKPISSWAPLNTKGKEPRSGESELELRKKLEEAQLQILGLLHRQAEESALQRQKHSLPDTILEDNAMLDDDDAHRTHPLQKSTFPWICSGMWRGIMQADV